MCEKSSRSAKSCVVVGSTTLAIFCAEHVRAAGHEVRSVLATDKAFQAWAAQEDVHQVDSIAVLEEELKEGPVDWLFSVVNPIILSPSIFERVREGAFNYHDSPLPRFAGTHATSWALMTQETRYAVSWHTITAVVDAGQIAIQKPVSIELQDTALSLNLKCYQAAREGFRELVIQLEQGSLSPWPQDISERSFYRRTRRPEAGAYLDWKHSAETLSAIVRGLDFGELYSNPLTRPKLTLGTNTVQIKRIQILKQKSCMTPGTLINVSPEGWCITTSTNDVWVNEFSTLEGRPVDPEILAQDFKLKPGTQLAKLTAEQAENVRKTLERLAPFENFWHDRLQRIRPIHLPYESLAEIDTCQWMTGTWREPLHSCASNPRSSILGVFVIYVARLIRQSQFQLGWRRVPVQGLIQSPQIVAEIVPMECNIDLGSSFPEIIDRIEQEIILINKKKSYPKDLVSRYPVLRAIPALNSAKPWRIVISAIDSSTFEEEKEADGALMTLQVDSHGRFRWIYDSQRLDLDCIDRISNHLRELAWATVAKNDTPAAQLNMLPPYERQLLIETWNDTDSPYPKDTCVHKLFEQQVLNAPHAIAVVHKNEEISYYQLNIRANQLAHKLKDLGVTHGDFIATLFERSIELVIAQLAIAKAGAIYVPLDPGAPSNRHRWMVKDCSAQLLITNIENVSFEIPVLQLNQIDIEIMSSGNLLTQGSSLDTAYVMYTSGTTGTPKGVLVPHQGIARLTLNNGYAEIKQNDRIAFAANPAFDASTFEVWGSLLNGATLVIIDRRSVLDSQLFCFTLLAERINVLWLTVCLLNQSIDALTTVFPQLDILIVGGDTMYFHGIDAMLTHQSPKKVLNAYGVTETTTFATTYRIGGMVDEKGSVPVGRPISNVRIYLLDTYGQLVPKGAVGEIYIGGDGLSCGYLNLPDLTADRFLPDPYSNKPKARMYKTGDWARYLPDGNLMILGRNDKQVKIRGFRIELGEIEVVLMEHPSVQQTVVIAFGDTEKQLVAYVVVTHEVSAKELHEFLTAKLPDYMIPSAFVRLDKFPLTITGKLDNRALPTPDDRAFAHSFYEAPEGAIETALADMWCDLLGVARVSRHDSFFFLGGHSLLAVRLNMRIARLGIEMPLDILFANPTLIRMAEAIQSRQNVGSALRPSITVIPRTKALPLSFAQQRLWFLTRLEGVSEAYHVPLLLRLEGALDMCALQQALNTIWDRHEALRSVFVSVDGQPRVHILDSGQGIALSVVELKDQTQLVEVCNEAIRSPFNLTNGPLIRALLIRLPDESHVLSLTQHHIVSDGWSFDVLLHELQVLYRAYENDLLNPLLPLTVQYPDYAFWQRQWLTGERLQQQSDYWKSALEDAPVRLNLPTDRLRPDQQSFAGDVVPIELDDELTVRLRDMNQLYGTTMFMTLLSAWAAVLSRLSAQDQIVIGAPSANRGQHEIERLIGFFVNTLAMRIDLRGEPSVAELLSRVQTTVVDAQANQDLPFEQVVEIVQPPRRLDCTPIFQVIFAWQNHIPVKARWSNLNVEIINSPYVVAKFDLELNLTEIDNKIVGGLVYSTALFDKDSVERQANYLKTFLKTMVLDALNPINKIDILDFSERELLLQTWNDTRTSYPDQLRVNRIFEQQALQTPDATAIIFDQREISYADLNIYADSLAHHLLKHGVMPHDHVVILFDRSEELIIAQLAILKANAIYVPLDPHAPSERHTWIINDCSARLLITNMNDTTLDIATIDLNKTELKAMTPLNSLTAGSSLDVAYVMYTSGSTGTPKGVLVTHKGISRLIINNGYAKIENGDRIGCVANTAFDASTFEIWGALLSGATLVILDRETVLNVDKFCYAIKSKRVNILLLTPSLFNQITSSHPDAFSNLDTLLVGADVLDAHLVNAVLSTAPPKNLINAYGPTESTTIATTFQIKSVIDERGSVPIGRPISNTRIYLLDDHGQPVPLGSVGEIYIGGDGIARGYLNLEELTEKRFLSDPFVNKPNCRMYKTGDLARYQCDGNLMFLGRNDHQVKIRGFRLELGEIEARLNAHSTVHEAVVIANDDPEKSLFAYVIADEVNPGALREYLKIFLPDYMVPTAFVRLDKMPLTSNGKIDRRALPTPGPDAYVHASYEAPIGALESSIVEIWSELLGIERISRHDSFFALGGHSLLAVQLCSRIASRLSTDLSLATLFTTPTLSALAAVIESRRNSSVDPIIRPIQRVDDIPLSFAQQRLWFLAQHAGASHAYHIPLVFCLEGTLDEGALQQALNALWARHEALRSVFVSVGGQPKIHLLNPQQGIPLQTANCKGATQFETLCIQEAQYEFDLESGPLIRAKLIRLSDDVHKLLITQHHIVSDGWSIGVLTEELKCLYKSYRYHQTNSLSPLTIQYPDYAAWQREWLNDERLRRQRNYWRTALADAPVWLNLPTDESRPTVQSFAGDYVPIELDFDLTLHLKRLSQQNDVTLFMTLLSAWAAVLSRLSGQDDIIIGVPNANRGHLQVESLIGFFVNMQAIRVDLRDQPSIKELLMRVKTATVQAFDHQDLPFEEVVEIVKPPRRLDSTPIFQVLFAWQNEEKRTWTWPDLDVTLEKSTYDVVKFDLELSLTETNDRIVGTLAFSTALFNKKTIERQAKYFRTMLKVFSTNVNENSPVAMIEILDSIERKLLIMDWNNTEMMYCKDHCIHQLFERQVERTPNATAIFFEGETLSYSQLNSRANKLAHRLLEHQVKPESRIAICLERSPTLIVGFLAILKAGATYVPLDPTYKSKRLTDMLIDADPIIVLADDTGRSVLGESVLSRIVIDPNGTFTHYSEANPTVPGLTSRHLAYIIYTSGSTGVPKGVMVEHWSLVNLAEDLVVRFKSCSSSRLLLFASCGFDAHLFEIVMACNSGASIYLLPDIIRWDEARLLTYVQENAITHAALPPSVILAWKDKLQNDTSKTVILEGEMLSTLSFLKLLDVRNIYNGYGLTEITVCSILWQCHSRYTGQIAPIGRPISNTKIYILDSYRQLVPVGAVGELYIGGDGVARGYLNRPDLTAELFFQDPFSCDPNARMYKTGDLAYYLPDGNLMCLGRKDHQIKIRGVRIELGEIETKLVEHPAVREALVISIDEPSKRLAAYVTADEITPIALREYLSIHLPDFMIPTYFIKLSVFPVTSSGKLDRHALPLPDDHALPHVVYEEPIGRFEIILANIWREVLGVQTISRYDSFFALGGYSLLAVKAIARLRAQGLSFTVRDLFQTPVLATLAASLKQQTNHSIPPNVITEKTETVTPEILPLIDVTQDDINRIISYIPGGIANLQDIYALSPLQDGILFHHLLTTDCDPYLASTQIVFKERVTLDRYLSAAQQVVNRHDILRTAFIWQGLSVPAQVVWRDAPLTITELVLDRNDGSISEQLNRRFIPGQYKMDLAQPPLIRAFITYDEIENRWILLFVFHHLIGDHMTLDIMRGEIQTFLDGLGNTLPPAEPFRNLIAQTRSSNNDVIHEKFFKQMLASVTEPTLPYGLTDLQQNGLQITASHRMLPTELEHKLRTQAKYLNVSLASLCHVAYGQVLSRISGRSPVVFNTVLSGRMQANTRFDRAMGLFINTLPIRVDLDETDVTQTIQSTHLRLAELLEHEHASLVLAQRCSGVVAGTPLTNALLNYRHHILNTKVDSGDAAFIDAQERSNYPLTLSVEDFGTALGVTAQVQLPVQPERICGYMEQVLISLAEALEFTPNLAIQKLEIIPQDERDLLLETWNETQTPYADQHCIHQLFEEQVKHTPTGSAIIFGSHQLSYAEVNLRANQLAYQLVKYGIKRNSLVAICVDRSPAMIVGLLSILKAGAACVPLEPNDPGERLVQILADAQPTIVLTDTVGRKILAHALDARTVLNPNDDFEEPEVNLTVSGLTSRHLAYVMFTSGSTGLPKGVEIEHQGLTNRIQWMQRAFPLTLQDRVLQKTPITFDVAFAEIFWTLNSGATMIIAAPGVHRDLAALAQIIADERVTALHFVPSMLNAMLKERSLDVCKDLRLICCSGEELAPVTIKHCQDQLPHVRVVNLYGPTEATIDVIHWSCPPHFIDNYVPIGRPISNTKIYLLDQHEQLVPLGAMGEICIAGVGVARGYLKRAELSAEKFCLDPFAQDPSTRMYKTGDLARYLPDGNLVFCGRTDRQIKIRGIRIEPGEIEAKLVMYAPIREAVVVAQKDPEQRLIAYVVADEIINPTELYEYLGHHLPHYMIPNVIKKIDALPLMPNGKLDYRALPAPDTDVSDHTAFEAPVDPIETMLAEVWRETLNVEQISRYDSFFALGGHSLLAVQIIQRLRKRGWNLEIRDIFRTPILATLARTLTRSDRALIPSCRIEPEAASITPDLLPLINLTQSDINKIIALVPDGIANIQDIYSLSPLQEGILFHHLLSTNGDLYLISSQMAFSERVTLNRYVDAFQQVVNRNDILRTAFVWEGISTPAQVVFRYVTLSVTELTLDAKNGPIAEQLRQRFDPRQYRINLNHAPLIKFVITEDKSKNRWILLIIFHHLIGDHTTFDLMHEEIQAFLEHREDTLPPVEPFRNFIAQTRLGSNCEFHKLYFHRLLADITEPTLPFGLANVRNGGHIAEAHRMLSTELNQQLRAQAARLNVSLACLCYVAWAQVLSRTSGQTRVVFVTVLFGRLGTGKGSERSMGLFINTLPFRVDLEKDNVVEIVRNTHLRMAELLEHEHASLALAQQCSGVPTGIPLTSALFNYRHNTERKNILGVDIEVLDAQESTNYPFTVSMEDFSTSLGVTAQVQLPLEPERICGYMEQALISLAEALQHTPNLAIRKLEIMPQSERELLLRTWNATETSYSEGACIHHLFEQQVDRMPNATAIVCGDVVFSYEQLNMRANKLCKRLIELDVKLSGRVAICMERSPAMIVSILAVLKAGASYVPLDLSYPYERLANILNDADPIIILADGVGRKTMADAVRGRSVLDPNPKFSKPESNPVIPDLTSRHLAYIIYTSGSTGRPKGVMIEHRSIVNYSLYAIQRYESSQGEGSIMASSVAFDLTLTAIFPTLLSGRILHLPLSDTDPTAWYQTILNSNKLAPVKVTPSHLALLQEVSSIENTGQHIHTLVLGGEVPNNTVLERWLEYSPKTRIFNEYGPTETTVGCVVHEIEHPITKNSSIPIGRPIANTKIYLIDQYDQLVPLGADGEICIGGHGVARGYINLPDLSAERFVPDPFVDDRDARMYKTGDLARYLSDGNLVFLGRNDKQIKIRGFRTEPGEIESRLAEYPSVHESVVLAVGDPDASLVAYIIADEIEPDKLRQHLRNYLPEYMVPIDFIKIDSFPLTPNGKLDHQALSMLVDTACRNYPFQAPVGPVEVAMAEIWCEVLGVEKVSRRDSFFALGGHSILAIKMIQRALSCSLPCSLNELFEHPILADFACRITSSSIGDERPRAIPVRSTGSQLPLFFVPTVLGDHSYAFSLARHIHTKYPVYALPWPCNGEALSCSIQVLTEKMITLMKSVQPKGPYRIAGYSAGGVLAYAIAEFLLGIDETVEFVGLIDVAPPHSLRNLSTTHLFYDYLAMHTDQPISNEILDLCKKSNADDFYNLICTPEKLHLLGINLPHDFVMSAWKRLNSFAETISSYEPLFSPLTIYEFYSTEVYHPQSGVDASHDIISKDRVIDEWAEIGSDTSIHFIPVPGNHWTIMTEVLNRKELGKAFNEVLETFSDGST